MVLIIHHSDGLLKYVHLMITEKKIGIKNWYLNKTSLDDMVLIFHKGDWLIE